MSVKAILVTGGAGYIGSHMVKLLLGAGYQVVTLDNLSAGQREAVIGGVFVEGDVGDRALLECMFAQYRFAAVMHFASYIQVGESVANPSKYYTNNVVNTLSLLDTMVAHNVTKFVFSSSAAVYGEPQAMPITELHPKAPINPYGKSKWIMEEVLVDYDKAFGLKAVSLRYFNAAGADPDGRLGECHEPETHLIPLILRVASGRSTNVKVFGRDYDTPDGTCIRDYVHIVDLCQAHLLALERLLDGGESRAFNLGNGNGFSVQQVVDMAERITSKVLPIIDAPRRVGDPARLVADATRASVELQWRPQFDRLETIIQHAWLWEQKKSAH